MRRRTYLSIVGTGVSAGLAGCGGIGGATDPEDPGAEPPDFESTEDSPTDTGTPGGTETENSNEIAWEANFDFDAHFDVTADQVDGNPDYEIEATRIDEYVGVVNHSPRDDSGLIGEPGPDPRGMLVAHNDYAQIWTPGLHESMAVPLIYDAEQEAAETDTDIDIFAENRETGSLEEYQASLDQLSGEKYSEHTGLYRAAIDLSSIASLETPELLVDIDSAAWDPSIRTVTLSYSTG